MKLMSRQLIASGALLSLCSFVAAEALYTIESPDLRGATLFAQSIQESSVVTVKPQLSPQATGDVAVLDQCLWSVTIAVKDAEVSFTPGKMICVGPRQEVLEAMPTGVIAAFGQCKTPACQQYEVAGEQNVVMTLTEPLSFSVQARNERK